MLVQAKISAARLEAKIGRTVRVLIDEIGRRGGAVARSAADAPEIDGVVRIRGSAKHKHLKPGEFADVLIEKSDAHDLTGRLA